jgi:hypothetical protein
MDPKKDGNKKNLQILIFEIEQNRKVGLFLIPISCLIKRENYGAHWARIRFQKSGSGYKITDPELRTRTWNNHSGFAGLLRRQQMFQDALYLKERLRK